MGHERATREGGIVSSASIRRGAVKTLEWWKHLRPFNKRRQNKLVRQDGNKQIKTEMGK